MAANTTHNWLSLQRFTAFDDVRLEFSPGVNVLVGENGLGKTHVLKVLYSAVAVGSRGLACPSTMVEAFDEAFGVDTPERLVRLGRAADRSVRNTQVDGRCGGQSWGLLLPRKGDSPVDWGWRPLQLAPEAPRHVFIPAIDMIGHARGFVEAYDLVKFDFDRTYREIVNMLRVERRNGETEQSSANGLLDLLGGRIEVDDSGGFYLISPEGRLPMALVAEGQRKIATLVRLRMNGWLPPGAVLLWDEPETNLNPSWMGPVVAAILALARSGVQVFLATHSYVILKELDLQSAEGDGLAYHVFRRGDDGTLVETVDDLSLVHPNAILDQYTSLYDREISRSTGRKRRGANVD